MPIDFRCAGCQKMLRTPDGTAGKPVKCPDCGTVGTVPAIRPAAPSLAGLLDEEQDYALRGEAPSATPGSAWPGGNWPGAPTGSGAPFGVGGTNPYQSPTADLHFERSLEGPLLAGGFRPTIIRLGDVFSTTWAILTRRWGIAVVLVLIAWAVQMALAYGPFLLLAQSGGQPTPLFLGLTNIASWFINFWIGLGVTFVALKLARGQAYSLSEVFNGGRCFFTALAATILFLLMLFGVPLVFAILGGVAAGSLQQPVKEVMDTTLGLGVLIWGIPGYILYLVFFPYYYLVVDRGMGPLACFGAAKRLTKGNKRTVFGIYFLVGCLVLLVNAGFAVLALAIRKEPIEPATIVGVLPYTIQIGSLLLGPFFLVLRIVIYLRMSGQSTMLSGGWQGGYATPSAPPGGGWPFAG